MSYEDIKNLCKPGQHFRFASETLATADKEGLFIAPSSMQTERSFFIGADETLTVVKTINTIGGLLIAAELDHITILVLVNNNGLFRGLSEIAEMWRNPNTQSECPIFAEVIVC